MGKVVPLRSRVAVEPASEPTRAYVELAEMWTVGAVRVVVATCPGEERSGPYRVVLRAEGMPDRSVLSMTAEPEHQAELMDCLDAYCHAMAQTLNYASSYPATLAPSPADPPKGAA